MAQGLWVTGTLWDGSQAPSIPGAIAAYDATVCDNMLGKFTSTSLRDNALNALPAPQREGCTAWVSGLGLFVYTGSVWWPVPVGQQARYWSGVVTSNAGGDISVPPSLYLASGLTAVPFPTALLSAIGQDAQALGGGALCFRWTSNSSSASAATFRAFNVSDGSAAANATFAFTAQMQGR